jgi:prepilin-type N-terminal cleavage/methylation domain-containing protein
MRRDAQGGFSLIELMVAMAVFSFVAIGFLSFLLDSVQSYQTLRSAADAVQELNLEKTVMDVDVSVIGENESQPQISVTASSVSGQWTASDGESYSGIWQNIPQGAVWTVTDTTTGVTTSTFLPVGPDWSYQEETSSSCLGPAANLGGSQQNTAALVLYNRYGKSIQVCLPNIPAS